MQRKAAKKHHVWQTPAMKKSMLALVALLTLSAMHANAQDTSPRWSIGLTAGPAFPIGGFHKTSAIDGESITAHPGASTEINGSYRFCRSLSVTLVVNGQENKGTGIPYSYDPSGATQASGSVKGNDWKIARILAGAEYTLPLAKKTGPQLLFRLIGGVQKTASPAYKMSEAVLFTPEGPYTCATCTSGFPLLAYPGLNFAWSFSYEADAGLKWKFRSRFAAIGYAGYEGSKPSKDLVLMNTINLQKSAFPTGTISLRAGVSYDLSR
jgi:hypothetical protein